ncbi:MAG: SPW repeat protein [Oricola sp.]
MNTRHWQERVTLVLGLWVIVSPWTIAHIMARPGAPAGVSAVAMWNHYVIGIAVALLAAAALVAFKAWEEWLNIALGTWLLGSPGLLGFSVSAALMWNAVIIGALIVAFSGWDLAEAQGLKRAAK